MSTRDSIQASLHDAARALDAFREDTDQLAKLDALVQAVRATLNGGGTLLTCGNGGSMAQAMHFAEEWTGRFRRDRRALPAIAFSDPTQLTCIANDFGFEEVFARQVEAHGKSGDLLLLLSTSGNSENVLRAAHAARERQIQTAALLGMGGGKLATEVDISIVVPRTRTSDRIQEVHLQILHALIEAVERELFPEDYVAGSRKSLKP